MLSIGWIRFSALLAAGALLAAAAATPALGNEPRAYGQRLVAQYRLPPETIARYADLAAGAALADRPRAHSVFADRAPWIGPAQRVGVGHNPYTLVLAVGGVAKTAGAAFAQWQAGWELHESPTASRELSMLVPLVAGTGLAAGQAVSLTVTSARVSFRGERRAAPMLGLLEAHNLDIRDVQLQVWSGEAPPAWAALPGPRATLLALAVVCLLAGLVVNSRQRAAPAHDAPTAQAVAGPSEPVQTQAGPQAGSQAQANAGSDASPAPSHVAQILAGLALVLSGGAAPANVADEARPPRDPDRDRDRI
jgi:hypothetical protein